MWIIYAFLVMCYSWNTCLYTTSSLSVLALPCIGLLHKLYIIRMNRSFLVLSFFFFMFIYKFNRNNDECWFILFIKSANQTDRFLINNILSLSWNENVTCHLSLYFLNLAPIIQKKTKKTSYLKNAINSSFW